MEQIKKNWGIIVSFLLILSFLIYLVVDYNKKTNNLQEFSKNVFYMDTYINIKIYTNDKDGANKALEEADKIYKDYHELTDRYNIYEGIVNPYAISNSLLESIERPQYRELDPRLYDLIKIGKEYHDKTNGLFNINMGHVIDVWKKYREKGISIPTIEELKSAGSISINDVVLTDNEIQINLYPNIDLGAIAKGHATQKVADYLKEQGFDKFLINAGGNVITGNHYNNGEYKIGIENPDDIGSIYQIIKGNNIVITTSGSYQRYYEFEGNRYHHIIDPNTLFPSNYFKSVTIINNDGTVGEVLSTTLFLMSIEQGLEFIKDYDAEAIWYTHDNIVIKTEGFSKYEYE